MTAPQELKGVMVALITPFSEGQRNIDRQALDAHIKRLLDAGVHGLVPGGSTGEFAALSTEERKQLLEQTVASAGGRVPVVAGIGDLSTSKAVELAKHAAGTGAAALMVVPPFYDAVSIDELRDMLREIHTESGLPIIAGLSDVGVKYLKDTSGNGPALTEMLFSDAFAAKMTCFNGWDTLTFYGLAAGAKGSVWGATNVIPELSMQLWEALAVRGDLAEGRKLWRKIFPVCKVLESYNYAAAVKTGMELRGWTAGGTRKPFALLQDKGRAELAAALKAAGIDALA
ncbi:hypothetical protein DL546_006054 [Coniochaeta pulveracea]|uniref:Dihydrodipicolinate synthase n=1 Tax=Coniochaeta pulveracea TaxID=177199 RepID=A0A420Y5P6_9PEZI|nr:hypothetical protein DL546_006054 [Coniochaeta pulveracea]